MSIQYSCIERVVDSSIHSTFCLERIKMYKSPPCGGLGNICDVISMLLNNSYAAQRF